MARRRPPVVAGRNADQVKAWEAERKANAAARRSERVSGPRRVAGAVAVESVSFEALGPPRAGRSPVVVRVSGLFPWQRASLTRVFERDGYQVVKGRVE